jgi:hypothetical protein
MGAASRQGPAVRATLCEIEHGLFYTTFIACGLGSDLAEIPQYQVVDNAAEARRRIEERCVALGYGEVIWSDAMVVPPSHQNDIAGLLFTSKANATRAGGQATL